LAGLARPYLGSTPIEIGSGTGDYALEWESGTTRFTATEADESRYKALARRFADHPTIDTRWLMLGETRAEPARHSGAVAFNVFEHIPDDVAALRDLVTLVQPGGAIVLIVPAFPSAMSRFDRAVGHQRRYTLASLRSTIDQVGLTTEQLRYINPVGLLTWYVAVKTLNLAPRNGRLLRIYDRTIVPVARALDRWRMPFGQAIFAVARTPS
jgi:hypothetical protein